MNIFDFHDYKTYLNELLSTKGENRGARSRLAQRLNCQTGYISQVLNGHSHFSLEHSIEISKFLEHSLEQRKFFMLLVEKAKAGSQSLIQFYDEQINLIKEQRNQVKARIKVNTKLSEKDFVKYYSHWYYSAIHIVTSIKQFQTKSNIAQKFNLTEELATDVLEFLEEKKFIEKNALNYKIGKTRIHLESESPMIFKHHTNWRIEAIKSLERKHAENLHYSSVLAMSKEDYTKIKDILLKALEEIEPILTPSPEEEIYSMNIDFFQLGN